MSNVAQESMFPKLRNTLGAKSFDTHSKPAPTLGLKYVSVLVFHSYGEMPEAVCPIRKWGLVNSQFSGNILIKDRSLQQECVHEAESTLQRGS